MAIKISEHRKNYYKAGPERLLTNTRRTKNSHLTALRKKLRHFAARVKRGKMTTVAFENAKARIEKEIGYTEGSIPRATPSYAKD